MMLTLPATVQFETVLLLFRAISRIIGRAVRDNPSVVLTFIDLKVYCAS